MAEEKKTPTECNDSSITFESEEEVIDSPQNTMQQKSSYSLSVLKGEKKRSVTKDDSANASVKSLSKITKNKVTHPFFITNGTGCKSQSANSLTLKRACGLGDPESLELSELSQASTVGVVQMEQQNTVVVPRRKRQWEGCKESVLCGAASAASVSAEKEDLQINISRLRQKVAENNALILQFEMQHKTKLEAHKRLQQQYQQLMQQTTKYHEKKDEVTQENRCLANRNSKIGRDVNLSKSTAIQAQEELKQAVKSRAQLQEDLHNQGKEFTQIYNSLQNQILDITGSNRIDRQTHVNLEHDVSVEEQNLTQGANHLKNTQDALDRNREDIAKETAKRDVLDQTVARTRASLGKAQEAVSEVSKGKVAGERLLLDTILETEKHRARAEVLTAGLKGNGEIAQFLQEEVKRLQYDAEHLTRTNAGRQGQYDQLQSIVQARKKELEASVLHLQQQRQSLQQLSQQYCSRLASVTDTAGCGSTSSQ